MRLKRQLQGSAVALVSILMSVTAPSSAFAAHNLTFDRIASAPFPHDLVASPTGSTVAWIYNERGTRNVWVASLSPDGHYVARLLTAYTDDDGVEIYDLRWNDNGTSLFYTRGGAAHGRNPMNPASLPGGPKVGEIWAVALDGGSPKLIGSGQFALPSPGGRKVVFSRDGQLWQSSADGTSAAEALFRDSGRISSASWSPDGSRLAFVSNRVSHSIIGIYDFRTSRIKWMSPSIDEDTSPAWSPDGKQIAFLRLPNDSANLFKPKREGYPWEIWVADTTSGAGLRIWAAKPGVGSTFREISNGESLFWGSGDKLIFPWEVTGWIRMYSISAVGGQPTLLTPGQSEIFTVELSRDRTRLVYSTNQDDIDRRHIWEVPIQGGRPHQLTLGRGVEDFPIMTSAGQILALHGEARSPMRPVLISGSSMIDLAPQMIPADFPSDDLVEPELVTFQAADGQTVHGQVFVPHGRHQPGPAIVFFHGGPARQVFASWDPVETHTHAYEADQYFANHGYIVLGVNYRGGVGYGLDWREAKGFGAAGASELNDIIGAARYLQSRSDVDPTRVGVWGGSYGGRMASLALACASEYFAAGVDYAGIHNWLHHSGFVSQSDVDTKIAYESSAIAHVSSWRSPVLLMHADSDRNVPIEQTIELAAALRAKGIPVEQLMIPDEDHYLLKHSSWNLTVDAAREYFDRHFGVSATDSNSSRQGRNPR